MNRTKHILRWLGWYIAVWLGLTIGAAILSPIVGVLLIPFHIILIPAWFIIPGVVATKKTKAKPNAEDILEMQQAHTEQATAAQDVKKTDSPQPQAQEKEQAKPKPAANPEPQTQVKPNSEPLQQAKPKPEPQPQAQGEQKPQATTSSQAPKQDEEATEWRYTPFGKMKKQSSKPLTKEQEEKLAAYEKKKATGGFQKKDEEFEEIFGIFFSGPKQQKSQPEQKGTPKAPDSPKIDINSATAKEFATIPAVNEILARKIVMVRDKQGRFDSMLDLYNKAAIPVAIQKEFSRRCIVGAAPQTGETQSTEETQSQGRIIDF